MFKLKGITFVLVLFVVAALAAGCGGGGTKPEQKQPAQPAAGGQPAQTQGENSGKEGDAPLAALFGGDKIAKVQSLSFEAAVKDLETKEQVTTKVWIKDKKMKIETANPDGQQVMLLIKPDGMYTIDLKSKIAMKMPVQNDRAQDKNDPLAYTQSPDWDPGKFKDAGTATVDGKKCRVVEALAEGNGVKFYVWEEYGFPLKVEYYENGKLADSVEYKNVAVNNVPDSAFDLPAGVQIQEVNLPNLPGGAAPRQP